ncbi:MAG: RDD family protein [Thermoflexales bacterium]|nr:RDD family protein [Thermoflexales bacterium]
MQYASFGKRVIAYTIDSFIVGLIAGIPMACLIVTIPMAAMNMSEELAIIVGILASLIAVFWAVIASVLYFAIMWSRTGQTLGKKWLGIKVLTAEWIPPTFWRAVGRATIGYWLSDAVFGLGFLWMLWDDYQQCWHDKLFTTYVIEA